MTIKEYQKKLTRHAIRINEKFKNAKDKENKKYYRINKRILSRGFSLCD